MHAVAAAARVDAEALGSLSEAMARKRADLAGLLEVARSGDADAFTELVHRFERSTYLFVLRMVRRPSVAEDLAQDVFIRLWRHLGEFDSAETLPAWIRRVAVNAVIDHWRKTDARQRKLQAFREHPVARHAVRPSARMETQEAMDAVRTAIDRLPPKLRSVLMLRTVEGLDYEELGEVLGLSAGAVRSRLFRARQEVHETLKRLNAADYLAEMYRTARRQSN